MKMISVEETKELNSRLEEALQSFLKVRDRGSAYDLQKCGRRNKLESARNAFIAAAPSMANLIADLDKKLNEVTAQNKRYRTILATMIDEYLTKEADALAMEIDDPEYDDALRGSIVALMTLQEYEIRTSGQALNPTKEGN